MTAGNVLLCEVIDYQYDDDSTGGAVPSGVVVYTDLPIRLHHQRTTLAILEQSVESKNIYLGRIMKHNVTIWNNNEIVITAPQNSRYYGHHFRVLKDPMETSMHPSDSRGFISIYLQRITRARSIQ